MRSINRTGALAQAQGTNAEKIKRVLSAAPAMISAEAWILDLG